MKLYATVQSERATKGQGGKELVIEVKDEQEKTFLKLLILPPDEVMNYPLVNVWGATCEVARQIAEDAQEIEAKALLSKTGYTETKGKQQKGERVGGDNRQFKEWPVNGA